MNKTQLATIGYLAFYASDYFKKLQKTNTLHLVLERIAKIKSLAKKHQRQTEYGCNGEGYVIGKFYRVSEKSAYMADGETTVFVAEQGKIEGKINALLGNSLTVEYQGDPRGATVRLFVNKRDLTDILYI